MGDARWPQMRKHIVLSCRVLTPELPEASLLLLLRQKPTFSHKTFNKERGEWKTWKQGESASVPSCLVPRVMHRGSGRTEKGAGCGHTVSQQVRHVLHGSSNNMEESLTSNPEWNMAPQTTESRRRISCVAMRTFPCHLGTFPCHGKNGKKTHLLSTSIYTFPCF